MSILGLLKSIGPAGDRVRPPGAYVLNFDRYDGGSCHIVCNSPDLMPREESVGSFFLVEAKMCERVWVDPEGLSGAAPGLVLSAPLLLYQGPASDGAVTICEALAYDIPRLCEIVRYSDQEHHERQPDKYWDVGAFAYPEEFFLSAMMSAQEAIFVALNRQAVVVGFIWVSQRKCEIPSLVHKRLGYIDDFAVHPDFRGKGIGRLLMGKAETWCRERSLDAVSLMVDATNLRAQALYRELGFKESAIEMTKPLKS